jgi:hypothetical protein
MKKSSNTYKCLFMGLVAFGMIVATTSCRFEEDDYFSESASLRVEHTNDSVQYILANAPNGWVMQYFCGTGAAHFEGFNLFANFDKNGKVTLAGNHRMLRDGNAGKYTEATSFYSLLLEDGPVLAFNTWNDVLTPFVDPVDPWSAPKNLVKDGQGMEGDHNFVIMSYHDDEIILRGERHGAEVRLVKCPTTWQEYIADTDKMKNYITNTSISSYYVTTGTDTLYFTGLRNGRFRYCENLTNPVKLDSLSCTFTPHGFRTEYQDSIGTQAFHEFTLAPDSTCLVNEDGMVKVMACWDNYVVDCPSDWRLDPDAFTTEQQELYQKMALEVQKVNSQYVLDSIMIGRPVETLEDKSQQAFPALLAYIHGPKKMGRTPIYKPYIYMNIDKPEFGFASFSASSEDRISESMSVYKDTDLKSLCEQFAATLYGTYQIKVNDYFHPVSAELMPEGTGNSIKIRMK